jgi:hypothetical protein
MKPALHITEYDGDIYGINYIKARVVTDKNNTIDVILTKNGIDYLEINGEYYDQDDEIFLDMAFKFNGQYIRVIDIIKQAENEYDELCDELIQEMLDEEAHIRSESFI